MIQEIETESHVIVKSKDLLKIIKILRLKIVKLCAQKIYKFILNELEISNNKKILFVISKTHKIFEQYWTEIYSNDSFKEKKFKNCLIEYSNLYKENSEFFKHMEALAESSMDGNVYLNKKDSLNYYNMKVIASEYNHDLIKNINNEIFDKIVKMIYKMY